MHVRERIRINGTPIDEPDFTRHFWRIYDKLASVSECTHMPMPAYFKFLTVLAFYTFLVEEVDVAIVEVGIGGTYDCTNVIR